MSTTKPVTFPPKRLAAEITSSDLSFKLPDIVGWDGVNDITSASFGTVHYITFRNDTNTQIEIMQIDPSTIANYATSGITINLRGLSYDGTSLTEDSARKFTWPRNETIVELGTNPPQLYGDLLSLGRAQTVTGVITFDNAAIPRLDATGVYGAGTELYFVTKEYVDALTFAGAPDASTTAKGIVEEATQAELIAGTAAGSTAARLFVNPSLFATSGVSKALISKTDGLIDDSLLALTSAGDIVYSNGTDLVRLGATTARYLRMNGTTPEWGGANLDEANTFFGATDITGSEAEDLTDGGTTTLHSHVITTVTVPSSMAYIGTSAGLTSGGSSDGSTQMIFADAVEDSAAYDCPVPFGATALSAASVMYLRNATGNLYLKFFFWKTPGGGGAVTSDVTDAYTTYAVTASAGNTGVITIPSAAFNGLGAIAAGDVVSVLVQRDATNAADTTNSAWLPNAVKFTFS